MKVICKILFGSHLYGTDNENSDKDFKAVYMASLEDIVLKEDKETIQECTKKGNQFGIRNSSNDVDCEYIELRKFVKDAKAGQTYALDMIFSPESFWVESSEEWRRLTGSRDKFLSKDVSPFLGYCRQQAGKYGLKGSRLGELTRVIDYLSGYDPKSRLSECIDGIELSEYVKRYKATSKRDHGLSDLEEDLLDVLGKKFQMSTFLHQILFSLKKMSAVYGDRAKEAMDNKGVDWKAISHAFRCCYQLLELADCHSITFPLKESKRVLEIKEGKIPYSELGDELYSLMVKARDAIESSSLPQAPDHEFWRQFILKSYLKS
jgi:hypothetical protein